MKRIFFIALLAMALVDAWACTAVIASGRVTADGRPFIFKNRDASDGSWQGNPSRDVEDPEIRKAIKAIVDKFILA